MPARLPIPVPSSLPNDASSAVDLRYLAALPANECKPVIFPMHDAQHRDRAAEFVTLLTSHQRDLYAYINTLLVGDSATGDVLQDTNLDLWKKMGDFDFGRPFLPWAYEFAYHRVLAYRKTRSRSRLVFTDQVVELIHDVYLSDLTHADTRLTALQACLDKLDAKDGQLIRDRYMSKLSVKVLAARIGSTANQISARLYRIRKGLARCVEHTLASEAR